MVICAKTAEPIEMLFGLWARMDRRTRVKWGSRVGMFMVNRLTENLSVNQLALSKLTKPKVRNQKWRPKWRRDCSKLLVIVKCNLRSIVRFKKFIHNDFETVYYHIVKAFDR